MAPQEHCCPWAALGWLAATYGISPAVILWHCHSLDFPRLPWGLLGSQVQAYGFLGPLPEMLSNSQFVISGEWRIVTLIWALPDQKWRCCSQSFFWFHWTDCHLTTWHFPLPPFLSGWQVHLTSMRIGPTLSFIKQTRASHKWGPWTTCNRITRELLNTKVPRPWPRPTNLIGASQGPGLSLEPYNLEFVGEAQKPHGTLGDSEFSRSDFKSQPWHSPAAHGHRK